MNEIVKKFLLAGNKPKPKMHLRQPGFIYSACRRFNKNTGRIQKLKEQEIRSIFIKIYLSTANASGGVINTIQDGGARKKPLSVSHFSLLQTLELATKTF